MPSCRDIVIVIVALLAAPGPGARAAATEGQIPAARATGRSEGARQGLAVDEMPAAAAAAVAASRFEDAIGIAESFLSAGGSITEIAPALGRALRATRQFGRAVRVYAAWLRASPGSLVALEQLARAHVEAGEPARAAAIYSRLMELAPDRETTYREAASVAIALGDHDEVVRLLGAYLARAAPDPQTLTTLGIAHTRLGQRAQAINALNRALSVDPDHAPAHATLGAVLAERPESHEPAMLHLLRAAAAMPEHPEIAYRLGVLLMETGDLEGARLELRRSISLDAERADAHYRLARLLERAGEHDAASQSLGRFIELNRAAEETRAARARRQAAGNAVEEALAVGDTVGARSALERLLESYPDDPAAHLAAARFWTALREHTRVLEATSAVARSSPGDPDALHLRGIALLRLGRAEEARAAFASILAARPLLPAVQAALGNALVALGRPAEALEPFETARALEPDNAAHYLNLAVVHGRLGDAKAEAEMLAAYRRALARDRDRR